MSRALRAIADPFIAASPVGARVRTRLRLSPGDAAVLQVAGTHLGSLAGRDLAARCGEGRLDARGRAVSRAARKRALTSLSSSRWAGAITRTSEDAWQLADRNLRAERATLQARVSLIESRLAVPAGGKAGRMRGYTTAAERFVIEDLDFAGARAEGRERTENRPSRGRRGKAFRRAASGIPTGKFRDRLVQMTANAGLAVVAVDPAYTSRWGAEHWLAPLQQDHPQISGHHAAAVVIGRRALGHRARRREGVTRPRPEDRGVRAAPGAPGGQAANRNGGPRTAQRQPPRWRNTATASRASPPDQAAQDRPGPPDSRNYLLLSH